MKDSVLVYTRFQKTHNVAQHTFICDTMRQEFHQLVLVYIVEESAYIRLNYVIDRLVFNGLAQRP